MNFTPGPWRASQMEMNDKDWLSCKPNYIVKRGEDVIAAVWCGDDKENEEMANAALISASPEMYDALESCQIHLERNDKWPAKYILEQFILPALAKARGEKCSS